MLIIAAIILAVSLIVPSIASRLNFTRFYAINLLFLSPCFVFGGQALLEATGRVVAKITLSQKCSIFSKSNKKVVLLIVIILGGYFLAQVGFINRVANSTIHSYNVDFDRMLSSNDPQVKIRLYSDYIPVQNMFSASWLSHNKVETAKVYADFQSGYNVLLSYGLVPNKLLFLITNTTTPPAGSFIYLSTLNIKYEIITLPGSSFNTSQISFLLDQNSLIYSNANSQILYVPDY
jgi:uncharacterized membrane protein